MPACSVEYTESAGRAGESIFVRIMTIRPRSNDWNMLVSLARGIQISASP